jgi:MerR family copper efflux transcriptional regulator
LTAPEAMMNIGDVAEASGLPPKTIRYYEDIGLVRPSRCANGYRDFSETDAHKLAFLCRARSLGFSIEDCRLLLSLYEDHGRASADVKHIAEDHLDRIARKIEELEGLRRTLETLVARCHGDHRPDCPILDDLAGDGRPS